MSGRISRKTAIAGLAAAGVLGVGIAIPAVAFAEGAEPSTAASPNTTASPGADAGAKDGEHPERPRAVRKDALAEALATELGIDKEKVAAALEKVGEKLRAETRSRHEGRNWGDGRGPGGDRGSGDGRGPGAGRGEADGGQSAAERQARLKERLDQAVEAGKLTREQADAILKAAEAGVLNGPGWSGRGPR